MSSNAHQFFLLLRPLPFLRLPRHWFMRGLDVLSSVKVLCLGLAVLVEV